jgi:F-type H+-transporting ATPase subunit b
MFKIISFLIFLAALIPVKGFCASEAHGEGGIPFKLVYAVANFLILLGLLIYFLKKPAKEFFASRATLLKTRMDQAQDLKAQAIQKHAEYESKLKNVQKEMETLVTELKKDGELERQRIIDETRAQLTQSKTTQEKILAQELRKAKEEIKRNSARLTEEIAEKLIKNNITAEDQTKIFEDYLTKLESIH